MPSTRRGLLRATALGVVVAAGGCSGGRDSTDETSTRTSPPSATRTTTRTTQETRETTAETTADRDDSRAVEFVHPGSAFDSGVTDAETWYSARSFNREGDVRAALDFSHVPAEDADRVGRFVAATDFHKSGVLAVQARFASSEYGLQLSIVNRWGPPHAVVQTRKRDLERDDEGTASATSTLLIRISTGVPRSLAVTIADVVGARDSTRTSVTFRPPNDPLYETANYGLIDALPTHSGALVGSRADADLLVPADHDAREFVRATDFDRSYLLAVGARIRSGGGYVWPAEIARSDDRLSAHIWSAEFTGGPSAEFSRLVLTRISGETPDCGLATVRPIGRAPDAEAIELSSDPDDWPASGDTSK